MWATMIDNVLIINSTIELNGVRYSDTHLRGMDVNERNDLGIYPCREVGFDESTHRSTGYQYELIEGEFVGTPILVEIPPEELTRAADSKARAAAISELAQLDTFAPRLGEDLITALNVDVTTLPQIQQERLARKAELRTILANTAYLTTGQ